VAHPFPRPQQGSKLIGAKLHRMHREHIIAILERVFVARNGGSEMRYTGASGTRFDALVLHSVHQIGQMWRCADAGQLGYRHGPAAPWVISRAALRQELRSARACLFRTRVAELAVGFLDVLPQTRPDADQNREKVQAGRCRTPLSSELSRCARHRQWQDRARWLRNPYYPN
jgi:hypothetical protein